jgi:ubiquinone/menaquinone biosynthesis C-methylase UbiE
MAQRPYDRNIAQHYAQVAQDSGLSSVATMADETIRATETSAILEFIASALKTRETLGESNRKYSLADVGCGNGYTLGEIAKAFPALELTGVEHNAELRALAKQRLADTGIAIIRSGDIRDPGFQGDQTFDLLICQRVIINLLDAEDQKSALRNIVRAVKPGGAMLFIEAFKTGLAEVNSARDEFGLTAIPPAIHNLYLDDDFFTDSELTQFSAEGWTFAANHLSTHYFVTRVLNPLLLGDRPFKRNSAFARFFTAALPPAVGNFDQLRIQAFRRRA